jgi:DNA-binding beta-propeller fold protein YncE
LYQARKYDLVRSRARRAALPALIGLLASPLITACGNQYRPVVSAINPVGPAGQPTKYAAAVSSPQPGLPGLLTVVDFSGDTVLTTPSILSNPTYFAVTSTGAQGYVINAAGSFNDFGLSNPTGLLTSDIVQTTLPQGANPFSISTFTPTGSASSVFIPQPGRSSIAVLNTAGPSLTDEIAVAANPVYVVGSNSTPRLYAISQGTGGNGQVAALEGSTFSISNTIPIGVAPVYGVMTSDTRRAFILNQGSGTVSVINVVNNALDNSALLPNGVIPATGTLGVNPVWADLSPRTSELVVLNAGDGVHPGSLNIISIPLCNATAQVTNPNCDPNNPVDATGFGTVVATVPVGINPTMVSVLQDGSAAYVCNSGNAAAGVEGSVSVVNLITGAVTATIPAVSSASATIDVNTTPGAVYGHPNTISATTGSPTGKVYVTSSDNKFMTVIRTDNNTIQTHINLQGLGVRVLVTNP